MKRALVVAPQPFFSPRGTPFSVYYRTAVLAEKGVEIDFLTYGEGQDVDIRGVRIIRIPRFSFLGNVRIGPSPLKLFLDFFVFLWMIGLLSRNKYDFVHAHEESVFLCNLLKPIFNFKMVYDMHSSLPQQLTNFKFTTSQLLIKLFERMENSSLHAAEAVITICPDLYHHVNNIIQDKRKHILIENSIFDPVRVVAKTAGKTDGGTPGVTETEGPVELPGGRKMVVYVGTLEPYQGIDLLIDAFPRVIAHEPDAHLLIVGGTDDQVIRYREMAVARGLDNHSVFTGRVPQSVAKHYLGLATVIVSPRSEGTNTPLKIYEYLASGIPMVATDIHSHKQVLDEDVAFLVKPEVPSIAQGIVSALTSEEQRKAVSRNARRLYEDRYSRVVYESKMEKLLEILG